MFARYLPFFKTYTIKCPDGTTRIIYKDVDKAFPLALKNFSGKLKSELNIDDNATAKLDGQYKSKIDELLFKISGENESLMINNRRAYMGYLSNPCKNADFYQRSLELEAEAQRKIDFLKAQVSGLISLANSFPQNADKFLTIYASIIGSINESNISERAVAEINANVNEAKKWIGGQYV